MIENIKIATAALDIKADINILSPVPPDDRVASIHLCMPSDLKIKFDPLHDFIFKRHTNRRMYRSDPVPASAIEEMKSSIAGIPGAKLHVITGRDEMKKQPGSSTKLTGSEQNFGLCMNT